MSLPNVLAIAGCVALLVGLFGGGIKAKEIEVPKIPASARIISILAGAILIGIAIRLLNPLESNEQPTSTLIPPTEPVPPQTQIIFLSPSPALPNDTPTLEPTVIIDSYVDTPRVSAYASSLNDNPDLSPASGIDGDNGTMWSSNGYENSQTTEWFVVDMGTPQNLGRIRVIPRDGGYGFPQDFKFQTSNDGTNWTDILGQSYIEYPNPGSAEEQVFTFAEIIARYVRMYAIRLGADDYGDFYFQFVDIYPQRIVR